MIWVCVRALLFWHAALVGQRVKTGHQQGCHPGKRSEWPNTLQQGQVNALSSQHKVTLSKAWTFSFPTMLFFAAQGGSTWSPQSLTKLTFVINCSEKDMQPQTHKERGGKEDHRQAQEHHHHRDRSKDRHSTKSNGKNEKHYVCCLVTD